MMPILMVHNVVGGVGVALDDLEIGRSKSIYVGKAQFAWWREVLYVEGLTFTHFQLLSWSQGLILMLSLLVKSGYVGSLEPHGPQTPLSCPADCG